MTGAAYDEPDDDRPVLGTPAYTAPEQAGGSATALDQFSLRHRVRALWRGAAVRR
jgi:hypothetical protein